MKKIDLRLVVTDENGKDNILSLYVPIAEGQEKKECRDFLDTVSLFINKQLNQEINNSFHFGGVEFNYGKQLTVEEYTHLASHLMGIIPIDKKCNNSKKMFMTEPISIYIKAENMNTKGVDILIYKDDYSYLKYTNKDFFKSKNLYKAKNIRGTIEKYIHLTQKCSSWGGVYITEGALNYIKYLHNLTDEGFQAKIFSYSPAKEILPIKQVLNSKRKELFQKTSPTPIVIDDGFNKDKTSFIINRFTDNEYGLHYGLYLYGRNLVSTRASNLDVFYKVISVNDNVSAYIDIDKDKLCSENLYISELSIIKIMERFDLSFSEFKEKVLIYDGEDYCIEEILEKEIANPELRSHQLDDINKVDTIQPEEDVCLIIENEPISYVFLSKLSEICGKEKFPESLYPGMFVVIETAIFMLLKDGFKIEEMVSVTNWFPKGSNKKLIVLASDFNALKEANDLLGLECKKIKIINIEDNQEQDIKKAEDDSKSSLKACEIKIKSDTKSVNFIELDIDDMVYFLKMSDVFEYTFTDSKLKMKDLLEKYKLEDLAYVIGYLPDGCEKKVIIEKRILPILEEVNKCLDLTAKKIKIKEVNK